MQRIVKKEKVYKNMRMAIVVYAFPLIKGIILPK